MNPSSPQPPRTLDWSLGNYEHTAAHLLPAARVVLDRAALVEGGRVVDVGCGTGNAALLAAALGARVTRRGFDATFALGDAAALPLEEGDADVVVSVFGVIFAPDAPAAAAEIARVTAPAGRIVLGAWVPEGAIHDAVGAAQEAVRNAVGAPAGPPPLRGTTATRSPSCSRRTALTSRWLKSASRSERTRRATISMRSPPTIRSRSPVALSSGRAARRRRSVTACSRSTKRPTRIRTAFRVTSRYIVATAQRPP